MADLKAFAEQLVNLSVKEVNELAGILKVEVKAQVLLKNQLSTWSLKLPVEPSFKLLSWLRN